MSHPRQIKARFPVESLDALLAFAAENGIKLTTDGIFVPSDTYMSGREIRNTIKYIHEKLDNHPSYAIAVEKAFLKYSDDIEERTLRSANSKTHTLSIATLMKENINGALRELMDDVQTLMSRDKNPASYARKIVNYILKLHARKLKAASDIRPYTGLHEDLISNEEIKAIVKTIYDTSGVAALTKKDANYEAILNNVFSLHDYIVCEHVERTEDLVTTKLYGYSNFDFLKAAYGQEFPAEEIEGWYNKLPNENGEYTGKRYAEHLVEGFIAEQGQENVLAKLNALDTNETFEICPRTGRIAHVESKPNPTGYLSDIVNVLTQKGHVGEIRVMDYIEYDIGDLEHDHFYKDYVTPATEGSPLIVKIAHFANANKRAGLISQDDINDCLKKSKAFIRELTAYLASTNAYTDGMHTNELTGKYENVSNIAKDVFCMRLLTSLYGKIKQQNHSPLMETFMVDLVIESSKLTDFDALSLRKAMFLLGKDNVMKRTKDISTPPRITPTPPTPHMKPSPLPAPPTKLPDALNPAGLSTAAVSTLQHNQRHRIPGPKSSPL